VYYLVIATTSDRTRPGLTYKVEIPNWAFEDLYQNNLVLANAHRSSFVKDLEPNTSFAVIDPNGKVTGRQMYIEWPQLAEFLSQVDALEPPYNEPRPPGRPEKRVLLLTTSKDRRHKAHTARSSY
jgi:hypothetical protein